MLLAAADPTGDATLVWRASRTLGIGRQAAAEAASQQLLEIGARVQFRHPLVRSAAYAAGSPQDHRAAHRALAEATDARADPERRVWHLAAAASGPDEDVAAELERAAHRVQARAGLAGAAAFMQRSAALTAAPGRRAERALAAAYGHLHAGAFDIALGLAAEAEAAAGDDLQRARVEQLRGQIDRASNSGREAPVRLLRAAKRLESLDVRLARDTYLDAVFASFVAGRLAESGGHLPEVAKAAHSAPPPAHPPRPRDLLLDGLSSLVIDGQVAAEPLLRRAIEAFLGNQVSADDWLQGGLLVSGAAIALWDVDCWSDAERPAPRFCSCLGALAPLVRCAERAPDDGHLLRRLRSGDVVGCGGGRRQGGDRNAKGFLRRAAARRLPGSARGDIAAHRRDRRRRDRSRGGTRTTTRELGARGSEQRSRPLPGCVAAAEQAAEEDYTPFITACALPELIEAAVRSGRQRSRPMPWPGCRQERERRQGSDWAAGIGRARARCSAAARSPSDCYVEAIERLARTPLRPDLARAHLLYGEWLRRQARRV